MLKLIGRYLGFCYIMFVFFIFFIYFNYFLIKKKYLKRGFGYLFYREEVVLGCRGFVFFIFFVRRLGWECWIY